VQVIGVCLPRMAHRARATAAVAADRGFARIAFRGVEPARVGVVVDLAPENPRAVRPSRHW
jgi:hypothetical protein